MTWQEREREQEKEREKRRNHSIAEGLSVTMIKGRKTVSSSFFGLHERWILNALYLFGFPFPFFSLYVSFYPVPTIIAFAFPR